MNEKSPARRRSGVLQILDVLRRHAELADEHRVWDEGREEAGIDEPLMVEMGRGQREAKCPIAELGSSTKLEEVLGKAHAKTLMDLLIGEYRNEMIDRSIARLEPLRTVR